MQPESPTDHDLSTLIEISRFYGGDPSMVLAGGGNTSVKLGGRMFVVVGHAPVMQALLISRVSESEWTTQSLFETVLPRLNG